METYYIILKFNYFFIEYLVYFNIIKLLKCFYLFSYYWPLQRTGVITFTSKQAVLQIDFVKVFFHLNTLSVSFLSILCLSPHLSIRESFPLYPMITNLLKMLPLASICAN